MRRALLTAALLGLTGAAQVSAPAAGEPVTLHLSREPGLSAGVRAALRALPGNVETVVLVQDLRTRAVLETQQPDRALIPASTTKLVTAASVLNERGGAGGWWSAELTVPAAQVGRASVKAVTLRGSGDPTLSVADGAYSLRALARQAYARGLREVGEVRVDDLGFDSAAWEVPLGAPMTALRLAEWHDDPPVSAQAARERLGAALTAQLRAAGVRVTREGVGRAAPWQAWVPPARTDGQGRALPPEPVTPVAARPEQGIASVRSASPFQVLAATLRPSDNLRAEELLGTLAHGANGTLRGALAQERAYLRRIGADLSSVELHDGSGLSRKNRLSPRVLVAVLREQFDLPAPLPGKAGLPGALYRARGNAFAEALPQAGTGENVPEHDGRGGTMALRLRGAGLDVRAKTGTLPGVSALAGFVTGRSGHVLAFAVIMNGPESSPILTLRAVQDDVVRAVAAAH
ncbi:D-alanyl-D-alanine carboxypeptidase [Deinococcus soli (ex Cha et al. 2016)]|uniref:D-alanyl-D-alanine carboxypeptidase/D-alanyl-D-alanine-endopeptidase (Penicillin-binding protein 4) n=2 Tax=Deinococcus soli (ex Cha et al. 2016) TaxID=1309411 RepID=A0ACC6KLB6_9DEIO|nr:D-alanyl-D-alanine carboxypeptidase [Deinococcus soli (ex Cha et al. 2016)]MDR6220529.1 D-alanyl-D-alanine carboxypeptidase/D-alanyl-D-alanine-endopeptidase (penicillin-binding protein 4) [Deinococcus soli (ex Cha et al. 2016)]MDR6330385.1 D-alanyl-D-alanine carboxypeptidase/D-alanyl-D-alanine-endopeptidase (penicillin-binding protein 4) [Deinococcus soli (ex Cha et al. 2016)]MDR6753227.1 D-alanyl-D-alanine carboxypeptidase/D-alanyl-D-alanine-endopeptidase (penicillin-binding protein 4) [Dein